MRVFILVIRLVLLCNFPEARVNTANFVRFTADFLSLIERTMKNK